MKKTTAIIAVLLSTALASPAAAGGKELGIGLGVYLLGKAIEGAKNGGGNQRRAGKGDQLIGRVGEEPSRNNRARNGNKVAPAVAAGGAAAVAYALPEDGKAPIPEMKPTPEQMAEYAALQASLPSTPDEDIDESVPLTDELGRYWGVVAPADAEKVEAAVKLGLKPSVVIPEVTGLKLPEPKQEQQQQLPTPTIEVQTAEAVPEKKQEVVPAMPSQAVVQDTAEVKDVPAAVDTTATTASVDPEPKAKEPGVVKPVEVKKPKAKVDL
ncbi:hypothetical protein G6L68_25300 [Agrobacterium fabrum]|uniref:hypothetical protein n=1 Tax=Agrobacterium fabrum TaxID=1176649 RepID=UPI000EF5983A|nr:hypothetical protein [Agrobacterium fabrum]AYM66205.1 hypothetical protein At12D13_50530 [Agrobacterium fabrum]NTE63951.1 hypothetical protein [Agrobacterium fabrum]